MKVTLVEMSTLQFDSFLSKRKEKSYFRHRAAGLLLFLGDEE